MSQVQLFAMDKLCYEIFYLVSRVGAVMRALAFHQCGLGWILVSTRCVGCVCRFPSLLREVFRRLLRFCPVVISQNKIDLLEFILICSACSQLVERRV